MKRFGLQWLACAACAVWLTGCGTRKSYEETFDPFRDCGQYTMPRQKYGTAYWRLLPSSDGGERQLIEDLLRESLVGLTALAVNEGRGETMVWMEQPGAVYERLRSELPMKDLGLVSVGELLAKPEIRDVVAGYVLYDRNNQESINAATVAAHVYHGILVDRTMREEIEQAGYGLLYDASDSSLADAWAEHGDRCVRTALVLMPTLTSHQRSTAIAGRMMVVNLNKVMGDPSQGDNKELVCEILDRLEPLSPVFGWEQGVEENSFVGLVSSSGNLMIPYDWTVNTPLLWAEYESRMCGRVRVTDPTRINYGDARHYMSFYMSDGDNVQWMFNDFDNETYFGSPRAAEAKMTFGFPVMNLSMVSPGQYAWLLGRQHPDVALMESLGGGYYYADRFGETKDRPALLESIAEKVGVHMRQHRNKVLALVCMDALSEEAQRAYEAYIRHNDELIGIVVIQYTPYAGGQGRTFWFENARGLHIPVLTVRYSIWNYGPGTNGELEGTPAYIASKYNQLAQGAEPTFSVTSVHAWSSFTEVENADDLTAENEPGGTVRGVESALRCMERLDPSIRIVNVEELVWQLRMHTYPEETKRLLEQYE